MFVGGRDETLLVFVLCDVLLTVLFVVNALLEHITGECRKLPLLLTPTRKKWSIVQLSAFILQKSKVSCI